MTSARFDVVDTPLSGLSVLIRKPIGDHRGYLERLFCTNELEPILRGRRIAQINRTLTTRRGTVRGLHFQVQPHAETKFVTCLRGEVFDVVVDLRRGSRTFLRHHAEILSGENRKTFVIPEGFAHGFQTMSDDCEMLYFHTASHEPTAERGIRPTDPRVAVPWPAPIAELSARDEGHPLLTTDFEGIDA